MAIRVKNPGFFSTVQDRGRYGYAHLGISPAGAADGLSFRLANLLVGNQENSPALEMTFSGVTLEFEERAMIAVAGAVCECKLGAYIVPDKTALEVQAGAVLQCGTIRNGARSYLAVQGGFDVPLLMGSASTHVTGHFGGHKGRRLQAGDVLQVSNRRASRPRSLRHGVLAAAYGSGPIRVTRGAQQEWFGSHAFAALCADAYTVSDHSDRAGLRLRGEPVHSRNRSQLLTDGIPLGAIQVPPDGQPIILFVDQQTTGGYPKIAAVITADMHRIGQLKARDQVRFSEVPIAEAVRLLQAQEQWFKDILVTYGGRH